MLGRLVHKADFERLLAAPTWSRSAHFVLHHLAKGPVGSAKQRKWALANEISTEVENTGSEVVDILPERVWFGAMVPKRHARRAVTRNLLKRQIREAFLRHVAALPPGLWLVRLRRAVAPAEFPAARSPALARTLRQELDGLLRRGPCLGGAAVPAAPAAAFGRARPARDRAAGSR